MAGFVYNPAESIRQDFQQAGSAMGNIFAQVIQQQKRDYDLAENTFANIEALKKDLNIYSQKSITSKANALLGNASQAILANGKLDYSKLGEIRQAVSDIKDLKTGYDLGTKEYERMLQVGLANKDNLLSFEKFYKDLSTKMSDENLVKNPRDLQAAFADTYTMNLDATKMFGKSIIAANPYQKVSYDVKDPKTGAMMRVQGELLANWTTDAQGNKIPPKPVTITNPDGTTTTVDYADQYLAQLKSSNPEALAAMKRQAGFAGQNMTEKQLVEFYTSKIPMTLQAQQLKSADEVKRESQLVQKGDIELKYLPTELSQKTRLTESQIKQNQAQTWRIYNPVEKEGTNINFGGGRTEKNINNFLKISDNSPSSGKAPAYLSTTVSKPFSMNLENYQVFSPDPVNPGKKIKAPLGEFEVNAVKKLANGKYVISGLQAPSKASEDTYRTLGTGAPAGSRRRVDITLDKKGFDSLMNRLHGMGDADQVENINTIEKMTYLSTQNQALNSKMPMKMSYIYSKAQQEGKPVLAIMRDAKDAGYSIYED
jgi:hypothetical protein